MFSLFFFFNDTATTEIYTLSLHDALPISRGASRDLFSVQPSSEIFPTARSPPECSCSPRPPAARRTFRRDRKSTRLNSSHLVISYAVFCLKKKKKYNSVIY